MFSRDLESRDSNCLIPNCRVSAQNRRLGVDTTIELLDFTEVYHSTTDPTTKRYREQYKTSVVFYKILKRTLHNPISAVPPLFPANRLDKGIRDQKAMKASAQTHFWPKPLCSSSDTNAMQTKRLGHVHGKRIATFQRKTKRQQLKGKIVSALSHIFPHFSHFFRIFPSGLFLKLRL